MQGIEVRQISKYFGSTCALNDVTIQFQKRCIYGLLGNNGAGKTTLLNIITNRLYPDSGEVLIEGESVANNDRVLSQLFMTGDQNLYPEDMRVKKAFKVTTQFYPNFDPEQAHQLAKMFELPLRKKITALSTGYASIFRLVLALSVNTPYLLLDEPVLGLDARHRDMFYKLLIKKFSENSCTIILSTHLIQEIANLVDHVLIIRDGHIIRDMPQDALLSDSYTVSGPAGLVENYIQGRQVISASSLGGLRTVCLQGEPDPDSLSAGLELGTVNLQDYFISLMNGEEK